MIQLLPPPHPPQHEMRFISPPRPPCQTVLLIAWQLFRSDRACLCTTKTPNKWECLGVNMKPLSLCRPRSWLHTIRVWPGIQSLVRLRVIVVSFAPSCIQRQVPISSQRSSQSAVWLWILEIMQYSRRHQGGVAVQLSAEICGEAHIKAHPIPPCALERRRYLVKVAPSTTQHYGKH